MVQEPSPTGRTRWQRITEMFHDLMTLPPERRSAYLDKACRDDPGLREEVEDLFARSSQDDDLLSSFTLHGRRGLRLPRLLSEATLGHYRLQDPIGEGGMGTVYKAFDDRLERTVAVKRMRAGLGDEPELTARFMQEAKTLSALEHPNICTIHDIGTDDEGRLFLVMPFYEGRTVKEMIAQAPLGIPEASGIAAQVCHGLARAHAAGIVHRDIKPANIIVTRDDIVKILDFGVAELLDRPGAARSGTVVGTARYMAPEQVRGEVVDLRADLWALGVVLFETIAGRPPFSGDSSAAVMNAIAHSDPAPLWSSGREIPAALEAIVGKALQKRAEDRYQSAQEMAEALHSLQSLEEPAMSAEAPQRLAVLPLACRSGDPELAYFADGVTDEIINTLCREPRIRVAPRTTVFQFKNVSADVQELGRRLNVDFVLEGSLRASPSLLRVSLQWLDIRSGGTVWAERFDEPRADLFAAEDHISGAVAEAARNRFGKARATPVLQSGFSPEVTHLLLKARWHMARRHSGHLDEALEALHSAVQSEPECDDAWCALAEAYLTGGILGWIQPRSAWRSARAAVENVLLRHPGRGDARALGAALAVLDGWKWREAGAEFGRAQRASPEDPNVRTLHAITYLLPQARVEEAIELQQPTLRSAPLAPQSHMNMAWIMSLAGKHEGALACARNALDVAPDMVEPPRSVSMSLAELGRFEEAVACIESSLALRPADSALLALLAWTHARSGERDKAREVTEQLRSLSQVIYVPAAHMSWAMCAIGEHEQAFQALEQAMEDREPMVIYLRLLPMLSALRAAPRFQTLTDRVGLPR